MSTYIWNTEITNAYIWIPDPTSIALNKSSIILTTVWQTVQLTATIEPTVSDKTITWSSDDTTIATVSTSWLVTCVTPWTATITATTVNGLTATCGVRQSRLPSTYQEVEWIWSSAIQYINTQYIPNMNTEIETELSWWSSQAEWWVFFWMTSNDNWRDGICGRIYGSSPTIFNPRFLNSNYAECQITATTDVFHTVILKRNYCTLDWVAWTLTTIYNFPYNWAIYLFCGNNGWSAWRHTSVKFKSFTISESWVVVRDFVPCYRIADGVIWMYDVVNDVFYTNNGSGTFTKGSDV